MVNMVDLPGRSAQCSFAALVFGLRVHGCCEDDGCWLTLSWPLLRRHTAKVHTSYC